MACFRSGRCISEKEKVKPFRNITYLSATFFLFLSPFFLVLFFLFYLSTSHAFLPPPLSQFVSVSPITRSQREVKAACAIASALYSLCPTTSRSVSDKTWPCGQCFHSADSPWRKKNKKQKTRPSIGACEENKTGRRPRGVGFNRSGFRDGGRGHFLALGKKNNNLLVSFAHPMTNWIAHFFAEVQKYDKSCKHI